MLGYTLLTFFAPFLGGVGRHYVAFIRKMLEAEGEEAWVLFNDEKVVRAVDVDEMKKFAYVYFFGRV